MIIDYSDVRRLHGRDWASKKWIRARRIDTGIRVAAMLGFWVAVAGLAWCAEDHGHDVVISAIKDHLERCRARRASK